MNDPSLAMIGPVIIGLAGYSLTDPESQLLADPLIGGVILFQRNFQNKVQLQRLIAQVRTVAPSIIIMVDQEGGRVQRLQQGFTPLAAAKEFGDLYRQDPKRASEAAQQTAKTMATELRACDIDLSLAPVLDCDHGVSEVIGNRSFSSDPMIVTTLAQAFIEGMRQSGMAAVGKHFPGHGAVTFDTHTEIAIDNRNLTEIVEHDVIPFQRLIKMGLPAIMPAHIIFKQVDPKPVGFSSIWLQDILRQQLNFQGVIISDDLGMQAAVMMGDMPTRAKAALTAGCDMIIIGNDLETLPEVLAAIAGHEDLASAARRNQLKPKEVVSLS